MSTLFNYDGPLMQFLNKLFDLMLANILWLIGCLPIVTIGASTTAMYSVLLKLISNEGSGVLRDFWKAFKGNFKQATIIWLIFLGLYLILAADAYALWILSGVLFGDATWLLILPLAALVVFVSVYVFPLQAYFDNSIKNTLKNAWLLSVKHLGTTLLLLVLDVLILAVVFLSVRGLLLFVGGLVALTNAWFLNKVFVKYIPADESEGE